MVRSRSSGAWCELNPRARPEVRSGAVSQPPSRFATAKALLARIHEEIGHLRTLYYFCPDARMLFGVVA